MEPRILTSIVRDLQIKRFVESYLSLMNAFQRHATGQMHWNDPSESMESSAACSRTPSSLHKITRDQKTWGMPAQAHDSQGRFNDNLEF